MTLTADRVEEIFCDCLFADEEVEGQNLEEIEARAVVAEGILNPFGFHPERLASHRDEVYEMLSELPDNYRASEGGGWSFLAACDDKHGNQWTGLHRTMDHLFALGIGLGLAKWLLPREMWARLPGGMPYVVFLDKVTS